MKILLTLGWAEWFLGTETHVYTMAKELISLGHEVDIFCYLKKSMWEKMRTSGAKLLDNKIEDIYDLAIINNNGTIPMVPKSAFKIFISNGVIPSPEYPVMGMDKYVSVSEEVHDNNKKLGYDSIIIRNGIDCERFYPKKPINNYLKNVLLISNKQNAQRSVFQYLNEICEENDFTLTVLGTNFGTSQWNIERIINNNDLVVSLGRGVYEAMACGRNVIVADYQGIDGFIDEKTFIESRKNNCSGRRFSNPISKEFLLHEMENYNQEQGEKNRELILKDNDIKKTVQQFLKLYETSL